MEKLILRYESTKKALMNFGESIKLFTSGTEDAKKYYCEFRSYAIQSFESSIESLRKFLMHYVIDKYQIPRNDLNTAYEIYREAFKAKIITRSQFEKLRSCTTDRNNTSHIYDECVAEEIAARLQQHHKTIKDVINGINL